MLITLLSDEHNYWSDGLPTQIWGWNVEDKNWVEVKFSDCRKTFNITLFRTFRYTTPTLLNSKRYGFFPRYGLWKYFCISNLFLEITKLFFFTRYNSFAPFVNIIFLYNTIQWPAQKQRQINWPESCLFSWRKGHITKVIREHSPKQIQVRQSGIREISVISLKTAVIHSNLERF